MATKLTIRKQKFVNHVNAGGTPVKAVVLAGYSATGAKQRACLLMKEPAIRAALAKAKRESGSEDHGEFDLSFGMKPKYAGSIDFMRDAMNNPKLSVASRFDAAKQLLPYENARIGEKGKKETAKETAEKIAGSTRNKFGTKAPPKLPLGVSDIRSARSAGKP